MNVFSFFYHFPGFFFRYVLHSKSAKKEIVDFLKELEARYAEKFDEKLSRDIVKRHVMQQLFINDAFLLLQSRGASQLERERNMHFTVMSCVYDTIMDEEEIPIEALNSMLDHPESHGVSTFNTAVLKDVYLQLLSSIRFRDAFKRLIHEVHQAQLDSLLQKDPGLSMDGILSITVRKGGSSLLSSKYLLDTPESKEIDTCWYELGVTVQMMDDLYDVYEDLQQGVRTFSNTISSFDTIKKIYDDQVNRLIGSIQALDVGSYKKNRMRVFLSPIAALGYVALGQLKKNTADGDLIVDLKSVKRKNLITDMEKIPNLISFFRYWFRLAKID